MAFFAEPARGSILWTGYQWKALGPRPLPRKSTAQDYLDASPGHSLNNFGKGTESAFAILAMTSKLGFRLPRSIPPIYVRSISASNASSSCVMPFCRRSR